MDLRQLRYFLALYEEGSTSRASRRMNIVQPALSMQVSKLERELGQKLFDRTSQGMSPTPAGDLAYQLFAPLLRDLFDARQQLVGRSGQIRGRIAVGLIAAVSTSVLAKSLASFSSQYPEVEVKVSDGYTASLLDGVRAGILDFAIVNRTRRRIDLPSTEVLDEELVFVTSADARRRIPSPMMFRDLAGIRLVLPSKQNGLRGIVDQIAEAEGVDLAIRLEVDTMSAIVELVGQSDWATILPGIVLEQGLRQGRLRTHRIMAPRVSRQIVWVHNPRRPLTEAARLFVDVLTSELSAAAKLVQLQARE
jgi:DNA-binding transcriptional LysR family regulator